MSTAALLPDPLCLHLMSLEAEPQSITAVVATTASNAACPGCHCCSEKVHSRYQRQVADLPWMGWRMRLRLHTRRFFCTNPACSQAIFTERLPSVVAPYARHTNRLADALTLIGFALGGEAGKRLSEKLSLHSSPDTLLRLVRAAPEVEQMTPRVLGIDDWSFRRGRKFGTILIDLERRVPVDLLPDREAETLKKWLADHPGIEIISRDRGGAYAEGARTGAPHAQQAADRWHLCKNLSETLEGFLLRKKSALKEALDEKGVAENKPTVSEPWHTGLTKHHEEVSLQRHQERIERYHKIQELAAKKVNPIDIARQVGMSRQSVYVYLQMDQPPERRRSSRKKKQLIDPYKPYLIKRWNEGCRSAQQLYSEIQEQGYTGSDTNVRRFLAPLRANKGIPRSFKQVEPTPETMMTHQEIERRRPPTALQVARWMALPPERRLDWQNTYLERLYQADPVIARTAELVFDFATMLRERQGEQQLDGWLAQAEEQEVAELRSFAHGLRKDYDAVKAGLTLSWSQGQVEGHVNKLKLLKRQMYGRAGFPLLRKRVLQRA
jgi:transposase